MNFAATGAFRANLAIGALWLGVCSAGAWAAEVEKFPSGLLRSYTATTTSERRATYVDSVDSLFDDFLKQNFEQGNNGLAWHLESDVTDKTHRHRLYSLRFQGRRVLDQWVKLHLNHAGFIEFATSTWSARFLARPHRNHQAEATAIFQKAMTTRFGAPLPSPDVEPVYQVDVKTQSIRPILLLRAGGKHPAAPNFFVVDEATGNTLEEHSGVRFTHAHASGEDEAKDRRAIIRYLGTNNCYEDSPTSSLSSCYHEDLTEVLPASSDSFVLNGPYFEMLRGRKDTTPVSVKVAPGTAYTAAGGWDSNVPADATYDCVASNVDGCPSIGFEAQNVHVHLSRFRKKVIDYINVDLGITSCAGTTCFPADPLKVIVNSQPVQSGSSLVTSNNAAYIPDCKAFGYTSCLVFFKPKAVTNSCGVVGDVTLFSVAREANVIIHEFQHYVTDSITKISFGTSSQYTVGDALHEGYSDYFAASHVVAQSGLASGSKILGYSFKNCPTVPREVATLRPFKIESTIGPFYDVGLTWASGLYQLRSEFDTVKQADLLAMKSLFFLTPTPGYIEAVEALVKADQALYEGAHVSRIRSLFYNELKFINGESSPFRDTDSLVAEVGFKSCTSLSGPLRTQPLSSLGIFGVWIASVLALGRAARSRGQRKESR